MPQRVTIVLLCVILFSTNVIYASTVSQRISVHLNPDITIVVGDQVKSFYDANGSVVFPIIYQGTTYLPVRAISALMGENIEWDGRSRTIYIGRTLSDPAKTTTSSSGNYVRDGAVPAILRPPVQIVEAIVMRDVRIMYDFERQSFLDAAGREVYPINYLGSNYLPVRAISRLMGETIDWDPGQRLITISDKNAGIGAGTALNENVRVLNRFLSDIVTIFDEATAKIVSLQNPLSQVEMETLAASVSRDVHRIDRMVADLKATRTSGFSEAELGAYRSLLEYAEATAYYILITENIVYLASQGQDYSIFAETFLNFALDAQAKHETARNALRNL